MNRALSAIGTLSCLLLTLFIISGCGGGSGGDGDRVVSGEENVDQAIATIDNAGGVIAFTEPESTLNGLIVDIPPGALLVQETIGYLQVRTEFRNLMDCFMKKIIIGY